MRNMSHFKDLSSNLIIWPMGHPDANDFEYGVAKG